MRKIKAMGFYSSKNVLVTGGTGLIGRPLVEMLVKKKCEQLFLLISHLIYQKVKFEILI